MIKKLPSICLLVTMLFLFSCEKSNNNYSGNESQNAIEITSIITFSIMAIALLIAYTSTRRKH